MFDFSLATFVARVPAILIGLALHEYAHAKAASLLGDPTPRLEGRLTINPLAHLDLIGTIMLLIAPIGWAKPVHVNPGHFRGDRKRGMMLVSLAGPLMNVLIAVLAVVLIHGFGRNSEMNMILQYLLVINVSLAAFNILPIPPLDGSKILAGILPYRQAGWLYSLEQYGPIILMVAIVTGLAQKLLQPVWYGLLWGFVSPVGNLLGTVIF
ncbi:MAG: site-2 protease family protein [Heliobacteriaceae bacterium]|nr:site-2 protease family protein [Heliobacteriaceae bacterium]MDD4587341.1 site-2 protease family protein [Heliobacteriaceae bacterium]